MYVPTFFHKALSYGLALIKTIDLFLSANNSTLRGGRGEKKKKGNKFEVKVSPANAQVHELEGKTPKKLRNKSELFQLQKHFKQVRKVSS